MIVILKLLFCPLSTQMLVGAKEFLNKIDKVVFYAAVFIVFHFIGLS